MLRLLRGHRLGSACGEGGGGEGEVAAWESLVRSRRWEERWGAVELVKALGPRLVHGCVAGAAEGRAAAAGPDGSAGSALVRRGAGGLREPLLTTLVALCVCDPVDKVRARSAEIVLQLCAAGRATECGDVVALRRGLLHAVAAAGQVSAGCARRSRRGSTRAARTPAHAWDTPTHHAPGMHL